MDLRKEFEKFSRDFGVSSLYLSDYTKKGITDSYINPTIIEERKLNVATMDVFSRLMMDRIIWLGSEVTRDVANIVNAELLFLNTTSDGDEDIKLYINSPGGDVTAGLAMVDTMEMIPCDVSTICVGLAASMGAVLLSSGTKGKRKSLRHGDILIHQPLGGAQGQASDILIEAEQIKKCKNTLYQILSENTGQSVEQITIDADRDHWFNAEEAKAYGLIDEIITKK